MPEAENKSIARRFNEEAWRWGTQEALEELLNTGFVAHDALPEQSPTRESYM